jgi:hypothetical protein
MSATNPSESRPARAHRVAKGNARGTPGPVSGDSIEADVPARFLLVYQDQRVPLPDGDVVVGRSMGCQVRFNAPTVSRQHVILHVRGDEIVAENLSTTTGTLLNGRKLTGPAAVKVGDRLTLGPREVRIERVDPDNPPVPQRRPALGLLPDGDDDEVTLTEDVAPLQDDAVRPHISFHTCPRCKTTVPFDRLTCPSCGHVWSGEFPSTRLGQVTSRNFADEVPMPAEVMAVYASEAMTIDVTLTDLRRDGAFVPTELLDAPGTECELTLLPDGQAPLSIKGKVVATRSQSGRGPAGLELRFTEMTQGTRLWIDLWIRNRSRAG